MKRIRLAATLLGALCFAHTFAQNQKWSANSFESKGFIENKGQFIVHPEGNFNTEVKFAHDGHAENFFFTPSGVVIMLEWQQKRIKSDAEKAARLERKKKGFASRKEFMTFEKEGQKLDFKSDALYCQWEGGNPNPEIIAERKNSFTHSYSFYDKNRQLQNASNLNSYLKLTYKNVYPKIDIVYEFHPEGGLKYSVIVHPGGNIADVKLKYSKDFLLHPDGTIHTPTLFGNIIDHAPLTFYADNYRKVVESSYKINGRTIGFNVGNYDQSKTLVIDPWTQSPTFNTNWDCIWEVETDASGNTYIIGGVMPLQLIKYNNTGVQQFVYNTPYDTTAWLGTFATDDAGNSYITNGSAAAIVKVNTTGTVVWNNANPGGILTLTEFWNIAFNCDQTMLVVGGTGSVGFLPTQPLPWVYNINMNTGNVINSLQVAGGGALLNSQEVRSITATKDDKYYFLTHDTIGYISSDLSLCPGQNGPFKIENGGYNLSYKCENFRYDNTGLEALAYYGDFVFVNRGTRLDKRDLVTGAIVATTPIPGGGFTASLGQNQAHNSGIAIDNCGNIFVGSKTGLYKFDQNLTQTGFFATTFNVYDVDITSTGEVVVAGSTGDANSNSRTSSVQSVAATACAQQATTCCDPTVCNVPSLCTSNSPVTLSAGSPGGTWSISPATPALNTSTGVFSPASAAPGTYTVTYTLACGSDTQTITVANCSALTVCQESNGTYTVSGGAGGPFTWQSGTMVTPCVSGFSFCNATPFSANGTPVLTWTTFTTGTNVTIGGGITQIQVLDGFGNSVIYNPVSSIPACAACPTITVTTSNVQNVACFGQSSGSFTVAAAGGAGPYTYTILNGATTVASFPNVAGSQNVTGLPAGTYTINVLDAASCPGTVNVTITQPATAVSVTASSTPATCGSNNGTVTGSGTGGTGAITYSWNTTPIQTTATATGLGAGTYTVTATDANGCQATATTTVTSSGGPTVTTTQVNVSCFGGNNATATASATGGTGTITYVWSTTPAQTSATATGLTAGTYTVTATDGGGCSGSASVTITQPASAVSVTANATAATCGLSDGTATANGTGGTGAISYSWNTSPAQTTATATGLAAGPYTVTATDANGCTATATATINNTGAPTITISSQDNPDCNNGTNGTATVSASGGTGTLNYSWNTTPVQTGATANNLGAGTYTATVTDGSGCSASVVVTITNPPAITANVSVTNANCAASDGSATVNASGGTGTLSYSWNTTPVQTTASITALAPGAYSVTVTDANGCSTTTGGTVATVGTANIDAGNDVLIPLGASTVLNATGGTVYTWTPATGLSCTNCASPTASPTTTTTYIVSGTDANGCFGSDTVVVFVELPCGEIFVPNAFSPNGDNENDVLRIYGNCINELYFVIFDRWGEKVFVTTNPAEVWDGTIRDKAMNNAVFFYYLSATLNNGDVVEKSGNITLIK